MRRKFLLTVRFLAICSSLALAQQAPAPGQQTVAPATSNAQCIDCHDKINPAVVSEWKQSKHSQRNVSCIDCHGADHNSGDDVGKVKIAKPEICAQCHQVRVDQYRNGKHGKALAAMRVMPNAHWRSMAITSGEPGCVSCHRVGSPRRQSEVLQSKVGGIESGGLLSGAGACDSCHSRHSFSVEEARQPQACQNCHSGPGQAQWEMYSSSRHGIQFDLQQRKLLPAQAAAPTCQTCHMPGGDHEVRAAWGFWGVRLPMPDDKQWAADRTDLMKALNIYGLKGQEHLLMDTLKASDGLRFSAEDWQRDRDKMLKICAQCHSRDYARQQLEMGDDMVRNADHVMAEAIRVVAGLYSDGVFKKPENQPSPFPWLTKFEEPDTLIEEKLQRMYFEHRRATFQGTFHQSRTYSLLYGLSAMRRDLIEIKEMAAELRRNHAATRGAAGGQNPKPKPKQSGSDQ